MLQLSSRPVNTCQIMSVARHCLSSSIHIFYSPKNYSLTYLNEKAPGVAEACAVKLKLGFEPCAEKLNPDWAGAELLSAG